MIFDGRKVFFTSTAQAQHNRIAVIYQEFNLIPDLSVAENIFIGREPKTFGRLFINWRKMILMPGGFLKNLISAWTASVMFRTYQLQKGRWWKLQSTFTWSQAHHYGWTTATLTEKEVVKLFEIINELKKTKRFHYLYSTGLRKLLSFLKG